MTPTERVPDAFITAQWQYLAGARGPWEALWRRVVAAWRCSRVARAHLVRARAPRAVRAAHAALHATINDVQEENR